MRKLSSPRIALALATVIGVSATTVVSQTLPETPAPDVAPETLPELPPGTPPTVPTPGIPSSEVAVSDWSTSESASVSEAASEWPNATVSSEAASAASETLAPNDVVNPVEGE